MTVHNILTFLEYLYQNVLSPQVICSYLSSIQARAKLYNWDIAAACHPAVTRYICSIGINSKFNPTPRGVFDMRTMYQISLSCDTLSDPLLYKAIFLTAILRFLRMSNIAPHSAAKFDEDRHLLLKHVIFTPPDAHLLVKWTKTLQNHEAYHWIQLPTIKFYFLCPVAALKALLRSRPLPSSAPLFANNFYPHAQVIDTHIRDALKRILLHKNIPTRGHGFHTFRRSGATLPFDNNVQLQDIMAHGLWKSSSVWTYLENASQAPSIIPSTFSCIIPPSFWLGLGLLKSYHVTF